VTVPVRFRFAEFLLSPRRRLLLRNRQPVPLIPKYFDLLLLLIARRPDAVAKHTIFSEVWSDVVVSDGALSQAIRTLRRTLGDDSKDPRFIRTVSRHGYQFVFAAVTEEADDGTAGPIEEAAIADDPDQSAAALVQPSPGIPIEALIDRLLTAAATDDGEDEARDIAEQLHALGTDGVVMRIRARPGHARALAVLRDARWTVPLAGHVPLLDDPEAVPAILALVRLRVADVGRTVARRWASAAGAGTAGGAMAGAVGGAVLHWSPTSSAPSEAALALAVIGAVAGGCGVAGVAAGLAAAEVLARSRRGLALVVCGACAGSAVAAIAALALRALLDGLIGPRLPEIGGVAAFAVDGLALGGAAGIGYGLTTAQSPGGGLAAPHGSRRMIVVLGVGICCAIAAVGLALSGRPLIGGLVHDIARSSGDAQLVLSPLGHLIGEPDFGLLSRALLAAFEGGTFGGSLAWGLTRRPRLTAPVGNH
jgi:DNA-binding winged helix-turn-helix (wHTH) protein